jgi:hypothetical protein
MATFRCDFEVSGDLILPSEIDQLSLRIRGGFALTIKNAPADGQGRSPGLLAFVIGPADSVESAAVKLRDVLARRLDLLSFATHARFRISALRRLMEWNDMQKDDQFKVLHSTQESNPPDPRLVTEYMETVVALDEANPPEYTRMALRYFRHALLDEQPEDQFMRLWLALEVVAENEQRDDAVVMTCPVCSAATKAGECIACGTRTMHGTMGNQAIEKFIVRIAAEPMISKRLVTARRGLMQGKGSEAIEFDCKAQLSQIVNELAAVAWDAIMLSIPSSERRPRAY